MRIERIELWHVAVPTRAPFRPAWIPGMVQNENRFDLVRLVTSDGVEGWTAATAMGTERSGLAQLLGPYFLGERADDIPSVRQRLREMSYLGWRVGWLEAACWDIIGKAADKPVWRLLAEHAQAQGGEAVPERPPLIRLYASTGQVRSGPERAQEVIERRDEGFSAVKLRVHAATLDEDLEQLRLTRQRVGDDLTLMVDANQGWRVAVVDDGPRWDLARARAFCKEADALGFKWVEEPLPFDAYDDLASLRRGLVRDGARLKVAGGELNSGGLREFRVMLEKGSLDVYQPDAVFTGGIAETWEIVQEVAARGAVYSPHTWTNGIGFAINLNLLAASPFCDESLFEYPFDPPGWIPEVRDGLLEQPWMHENGCLRAPTLPGLGFAIDERALHRHGERLATLTRTRVAIKAVWDRGIKTARALGERRDRRLAARSAELDARLAAGETPTNIALGAPPAEV